MSVAAPLSVDTTLTTTVSASESPNRSDLIEKVCTRELSRARSHEPPSRRQRETLPRPMATLLTTRFQIFERVEAESARRAEVEAVEGSRGEGGGGGDGFGVGGSAGRGDDVDVDAAEASRLLSEADDTMPSPVSPNATISASAAVKQRRRGSVSVSRFGMVSFLTLAVFTSSVCCCYGNPIWNIISSFWTTLVLPSHQHICILGLD
ncbi:hypothetical protein BXZ70DRAFT_735149 [Cristinia sonorae]|uniref:Uncharacterized protein n=1 Tax=Cristinia sonorae TaxID=1940300 RepID=A0A8K0UT48_9AGAR|nr:hypothetical protein BXZ70DRAFT_735149 [Cristinia sonorae]